MSDTKWYLRTQDETFGPETKERLVEWARLGRIQPGQEISDDNVVWQRVEDVPFLDMRFSIDIGDGNPRGPFNRAAADALIASGRLPMTARVVEVREPFPAEEEKDAIEPDGKEPAQEPPAEKVVVKEVRVEVPVEKVVEKEVIKEVRIEVPVEKVVEKEVIKEVRIEVPVEKIVIDETRVKELEGLLDEERRHTAELQTKMDDVSRNAAEAAKAAIERENGIRAELQKAVDRGVQLEASLRDAADRENKYEEQVKHLEDELRRLPQAASEVADIQAAIYGIMRNEAEEIGKLIEQEKREFEDARKRYSDRTDRLLERRREMLRRAGGNIEEMTRKALIERPEDPRTAQLRRELDDLRRTHERVALENEQTIKELTERLRQSKAGESRLAAGMKDITQLRGEVQELRERLQTREKELVVERERNEKLSQQQATSQQALMARLASLESPSIGTANSLSTNQSREARQVKLPGWMRLKR